MTTPPAGLSRRALFGLGGSTLLIATAATAWRWRTFRTWRAEASRRPPADAPIPYAEHHGWLVSVAEKRELQAWAADRTGPHPLTVTR